MLHVVLYQPEIPPNTGNIIRLCANTGFGLHLVEPLGFDMDDKRLRRAGLDYREWQQVRIHRDWEHFIGDVEPGRIFALSTRGTTAYTEPGYRAGDALVFGPETRGLPSSLLDARRSLPAYPHATPEPESQPVQCRRHCGLRSLAAVGFCWKLVGHEVALVYHSGPISEPGNSLR